MRRFPAYLILAALALGAPRAFAAVLHTVVSVPVMTGGTLVSGAPITVSAIVSSPDGNSPFTGTITFTVNGSDVQPPINPVNGTASIPLSFPAGTQSISAYYNGDANYLPSVSSGPVTLQIDRATPTLTVTSNTAQIDQPVTISAALALANPASGTPTGTVIFSTLGAPISGCGAVPVQNASAVCNTSFSQLSTFNIVVSYSGDANTKPSSFVMPLTVGKVLAGISVATTPAAPVYGTPVTIGAALTGANGVPAPTGNVSFQMGGATLAPVSVGAGGGASATFPGLLNAGAYQATALYSGDANYQSLSSLPLSFTVAKAATTLVLTSLRPQAASP